MKRNIPLRRHTSIKRGGRLRSRSTKHAALDRDYTRRKAAYLAAHPFCQIFIARHELDEEHVIRNGGTITAAGPNGPVAITVPRSDQIHHRNKRTGDRKNDERWWLAACFEEHEWVERHKDVARALGLLLPIQADEDGRWGDGNAAQPTPEYLARRINRHRIFL